MNAVRTSFWNETHSGMKLILVSCEQPLSFVCFSKTVGSRDGAVVRALASHQCGPGSIPICGLSLCWFSTLLRGFFSGYSGFPPSAKTDTQLIQAGCWLCSKVTHGPYSGCQRRLYMLSVRPCRAASLLYFSRAISETVLIIIIIVQ